LVQLGFASNMEYGGGVGSLPVPVLEAMQLGNRRAAGIALAHINLWMPRRMVGHLVQLVLAVLTRYLIGD
jgi:hypothetical protein